MFLNQLLEEYKEANDNDKQEILNSFLQALWDSKYKFKKYKKYYTYKVNEKALNYTQDLIDLFDKYNKVEYTVCKSFYKKRLDFIDYIRIHINNMYGYLTDKDVYYKSEYYKLLLTPKREYYKAINTLKEDGIVDCKEIKVLIEESFQRAEIIKQQCIIKKHKITFNKYKQLINTYIERIFNNYIPVHEYEEQYGWDMRINIDGWSEDNYVIKYFCKSLTGYLRNYIRDLKPKEVKKKYCVICDAEIVGGNRKKYCGICADKIKLQQNRASDKKYKLKIKARK